MSVMRRVAGIPILCAAGCLCPMAAGASPSLISLDFIWASTATPYSGDTTLTPPNENTAGLVYTGQSGEWNVVNVDPNNAQNINYAGPTGPSALLKSGAGATTGVRFTITSGHRSGVKTWPPAGSQLREESAGTYGVPGNTLVWELTGLNPARRYNLTLFGYNGGTHTANGVPPDGGALDADGDANWSGIGPDASGRIIGSLYSTSEGAINGLQIEELPSPLRGFLLIVR